MPASDAAPSAAAALTLSSGSSMKGPAPFMRTQACTNTPLLCQPPHGTHMIETRCRTDELGSRLRLSLHPGCSGFGVRHDSGWCLNLQYCSIAQLVADDVAEQLPLLALEPHHL